MAKRDEEAVGRLRRQNTSRHERDKLVLEADAVQRCIAALIPLDEDARARVLAAVSHLLGLHQLADAITRGALLKPSVLTKWGGG